MVTFPTHWLLVTSWLSWNTILNITEMWHFTQIKHLFQQNVMFWTFFLKKFSVFKESMWTWRWVSWFEWFTVFEVILNHVKIKNTLKEITFLKYYFNVFLCLCFIFIFPFYQPLGEGENSKLLQLRKIRRLHVESCSCGILNGEHRWNISRNRTPLRALRHAS